LGPLFLEMGIPPQVELPTLFQLVRSFDSTVGFVCPTQIMEKHSM
jgi:hypothetical protein